MRKLWKNQPNYVIRIGLFVFAAAVFLLGYGHKERQLYREFEERVAKEQAAKEQGGKTQKPEVQDTEDQNTEDQNTEGQTAKALEDRQQETAGEQSQAKEESPEPAAAALESPENIRVILMNNEGSSYCHEQAVVQAGCELELTGAVSMTCPPETPVDLGQLLPGEGSVTVRTSDPGEKLSVVSMKRAQGIPSYEGSLTVRREKDGFCLVNTVDLETYLKYVVPSEMPSDYPAEALKAQAVCARTYAVSQIREARLDPSYRADVDDSVSFQVYNNIDRQESTDRAVDETGGEVMASLGEPIQAYFFSTSCGHTSTDEVWEAEEAAPYLKSTAVSGRAVEAAASGGSAGADLSQEESFRTFISQKNQDDYEREEAWYRWSITLPFDAIQERAGKKWPGIGEVQALTIEKRSAGGAAEQMSVVGSQDVGRLSNEYAIREFLSPKGEPVLCNDGSENTSMSILPSAYICIDSVVNEGRISGFSILGGGYGHGVGMSQNGAKYLARDGMEYRRILEMFFQEFDLAALEN